MDKVGGKKKKSARALASKKGFPFQCFCDFCGVGLLAEIFSLQLQYFLTQQSNCQPLQTLATPLFGLRFRLHPWHRQLGFSPQVTTIVRTGSTMLLAQYSLVHDKNCWLVNQRCQAFLMGQFVHQDWKLRFQSTGITVTCPAVLIELILCETHFSRITTYLLYQSLLPLRGFQHLLGHPACEDAWTRGPRTFPRSGAWRMVWWVSEINQRSRQKLTERNKAPTDGLNMFPFFVWSNVSTHHRSAPRLASRPDRMYHNHSQQSTNMHTSSAAQGGGGSFKDREPIGEVCCCESRRAERIHTDGPKGGWSCIF